MHGDLRYGFTALDHKPTGMNEYALTKYNGTSRLTRGARFFSSGSGRPDDQADLPPRDPDSDPDDPVGQNYNITSRCYIGLRDTIGNGATCERVQFAGSTPLRLLEAHRGARRQA